jgi:hypothetical protein
VKREGSSIPQAKVSETIGPTAGVDIKSLAFSWRRDIVRTRFSKPLNSASRTARTRSSAFPIS